MPTSRTIFATLLGALLGLLILAGAAYAGDWCREHGRTPHPYVLIGKQAMA